MPHREGSFKGLKDYNIYRQCWLPEGAPRAVLLVAHGFGEHSGRYQNLVDYFQPLDYAIYALDHRGHGKSDGLRVEVDDYGDYVADLKTFFDLVRKENASGDIFLVGHSMGASIATAYAAQYQDDLAGLILSGGGIATNTTPPRPAGLELADTLSRDPAVVEAYRNDPLVYHGALPTGRDSAMAQMRERLPELVGMIRLPILVMAGAASPLGDGPRSEALFEAVSSPDKTLKLYPDLLHEIFNEPEWPNVMDDMAAWLEERIQ
jgi:lysophospholipase